MKSINLTFNVHHPVQLKKYRFFDIGNDSYYYDDFENERIIKEVAENCYLPANQILIRLIRQYKGQFKVTFSISGTAIDLFSMYAPKVIESFQHLSATGCVEFTGSTYAHSLVSLRDREEFKKQTETHSDKIAELFGQRPKVFKNTGLIYSNYIGDLAVEAGFEGVLIEGSRHILRWRSPNYLYSNPGNSELMILPNNTVLSENLAFRFANPGWTGWPATDQNFISILNNIPEEENIVNLILDYETLCKGQKSRKEIYNFLESLPLSIFEMTDFGFMNPSEIIAYNQPVASLNVPETISAYPFEKGTTLFLGNELQQEAYEKLYEIKDRVDYCSDPDLLKDWLYLQTSDHFLYMIAPHYNETGLEGKKNRYDNFYEAFMNYMNVLNDFILRVNRSVTMLKTDFALKNMINRVTI